MPHRRGRAHPAKRCTDARPPRRPKSDDPRPRRRGRGHRGRGHARAWVVRCATRRWVRTRDVREQLVGACPLVVDTTDVHVYGSAPSKHTSSWPGSTRTEPSRRRNTASLRSRCHRRPQPTRRPARRSTLPA
ncbi:YrhB domain-containing protein [Nocardioides litoris]|uniref:YrhB domain-containing protein n=1 Tax=Nocardioides litoris TaxID=1926648 RepID=UPI0011200F2E